MIVFDRVSKRYPNGREALVNVSFNIHNGEMVFLTGRSGAGKSTVLKLIALLERPDARRGAGQRPEHPDDQARGTSPPSGAASAWCSRTTSCSPTARCTTTSPCRWSSPPRRCKEIDKRVRAALDQVGLLGKERAAAPGAVGRASSSASASRAPWSASRRC